jgi:hypothetical protein
MSGKGSVNEGSEIIEFIDEAVMDPAERERLGLATESAPRPEAIQTPDRNGSCLVVPLEGIPGLVVMADCFTGCVIYIGGPFRTEGQQGEKGRPDSKVTGA